jgi:trigger factor
VKTKVEKLSNTRAKLTITVTPEELKPAIKHAYEHISESLNIPGFRKGKAPAALIDQRVGRMAVLEHAVNEGLEGYYRQAVVDEKVRPMGRPAADITTWPAEKDFSGDLVVEIEVDVRPEVKLPKFEDITVEVEAAAISKDDVQKELDDLRSRFGTLVTVDRPAKKGDFAQLDLIATIGGKEVDTAQSISYEVGSGELIDGIDEAIDSLTAGESTTFESDLLGGDHEGEKAQIAVTVTAVKERELPKADDDFAQIASEFDTIAELTESLKAQAEQRKVAVQAREAQTKLIDQLVDSLKIEVPQGVIDDEVNRHLDGEGRLEDDKHRAEVNEETLKMFSSQILLDSVAEAEGIQVSQDELTQYIVQGAMQYQMDPSEFAKILTENNQVPSMVAEVARNKAIGVLLGKVKVVDTKGKAVDMGAFAIVEEKPAKAEKADAADKPAAKKPAAKKPAAKKD